SNIRLVKYINFPKNTSAEELAWRKEEEMLQLKHHNFWKSNNINFQNSLEQFEND
ncbi:hypothetical protein HK099_002608, partial [Clydaea vesicula]